MKKIVLVMLICLIFISGAQAASTSLIDLNQSLRVGLIEYYETVDSIKLSNNSLVLGYHMEGVWTPEVELMSSTGYTVQAALNYYLVSTQTFGNYEEISAKVTLLRAQGNEAYVGSASPGIWKVYVGDSVSEAEANSLKNNLEVTMDLTYEVVTDNGLRTLLSYEGGNPILLENSYAQAAFGTNDLINGVNVIALSKRNYRGKMEIGRYNKAGVTAINIVGLEDYLYGVVPSEMVSTWPIEALKAQAVAARNFAVYNAIVGKKYKNEAYAIGDTVNSQVYKGFSGETATCNGAINETFGKLIYFGDTVIPAYFFSTSGGHTENSQYVWGGTVPYLKGVPDIYEIQPEKQPWLKSLTAVEIEAILTKNAVSIGNITNIEVTSYTDAGRAMSLKVTGTTGNHEIPLETMRYWLGLNSRKFTLVKSGYLPQSSFSALGSGGKAGTIQYNQAHVINGSSSTTLIPKADQLMVFTSQNIYNLPMITGVTGTYIFVGEGYGHGVGMSQSGAKGMALKGFTYAEILQYYYSGTVVK